MTAFRTDDLSREEHEERAAHHIAAAHHLLANGYQDWAVTAMFYSAVHLVGSLLVERLDLPPAERHPTSHKGDQRGRRGRTVLVRDEMRKISLAYTMLANHSHTARYGAQRDLSAKDIKSLLRCHWAVEQFIRAERERRAA